MHRPRPLLRSWLLGAILGFVGGTAGLIAAPPAAAAEGSFGPISATGTFGTAITFSEPAVVPDGAIRVEVVIDVGTGARSLVAPVQAPAGSTTLTYQYLTPLGGTLPNTVVTGHFRITRADRTQLDGPTATVHYEDTRFQWQTLAGRIVRVHWTSGGSSFGQRALKIGDDAVTRISAFLGVTETDPVDFFIYADRSAFYDVLGPSSRENVGGVAFPGIRTLFANIDTSTINDPWVGIVIPHELTHLVIDTATRNPYHDIPHWMNEGIAVYLSQGYDASDRSDTARAVRGGALIPLGGLIGQFPTTADRFSLAYSESVSAVDYLVRTWGKDALVRLIRSYATGVTDDEAFRASLGTDVAGFEAGWLRDLGATAPTAYGPVAAPPGPVPSGWDGLAPTPGVVAAPVSTAPGAAPQAEPLLVPLAVGAGAGLLIGLILTLRRAGRRTSRAEMATHAGGAPDAGVAPGDEVAQGGGAGPGPAAGAPDDPNPPASEGS